MRGAPKFAPLTMRDVEDAPDLGLKVASTFSGAGGSCLGYRLAGARVLWANEMVPHAISTYRENHPETHLDDRDVRTVQAEDILRATKLERGQLDLFDGSPPCQSFSTAGKRKVSDPRATLFGDYARLLVGLRPRVFVAENVPGMSRGVTKGIFVEVLALLREAGYAVSVRELDAQWLGVPQARRRLFFVGVRDDLAARGFAPVFPQPFAWRWSIADACPWLANAKIKYFGFGSFNQGYEHPVNQPGPIVTKGGLAGSNISEMLLVGAPDLEGPSIEGTAIGKERLEPGQKSKKYLNLVNADPKEPSPTITRTAGSSAGTAGVVIGRRKFSILELKRICGFPDDFVLRGSFADQWARLGNSVPPPVARAVASELIAKVLIPAKSSAPQS